jgi:hypothetical protein
MTHPGRLPGRKEGNALTRQGVDFRLATCDDLQRATGVDFRPTIDQAGGTAGRRQRGQHQADGAARAPKTNATDGAPGAAEGPGQPRELPLQVPGAVVIMYLLSASRPPTAPSAGGARRSGGHRGRRRAHARPAPISYACGLSRSSSCNRLTMWRSHPANGASWPTASRVPVQLIAVQGGSHGPLDPGEQPVASWPTSRAQFLASPGLAAGANPALGSDNGYFDELSRAHATNGCGDLIQAGFVAQHVVSAVHDHRADAQPTQHSRAWPIQVHIGR